LKEALLEHILCRPPCGRGYGPVIREATELNEWWCSTDGGVEPMYFERNLFQWQSDHHKSIGIFNITMEIFLGIILQGVADK